MRGEEAPKKNVNICLSLMMMWFCQSHRVENNVWWGKLGQGDGDDDEDGNDDDDGNADNDDDALLPADTFLSNSHDSARLQVNREFRSNFT